MTDSWVFVMFGKEIALLDTKKYNIPSSKQYHEHLSDNLTLGYAFDITWNIKHVSPEHTKIVLSTE